MSNPINMIRQKGATLLIGLVMLIVLTLIVISSFNFGKTNLEIVSNMQQRQETIGAAQQALELAINSSRFVEYPLDVYTEPCNGSNKLCIDVNGDGANDVNVELKPAPTCLVAQTIKSSSLNFAKEEDTQCSTGVQQTAGIEGSVTGDSRCSETIWEITAHAEDVATGATADVTQGVAIRVDTNNIVTACPTT
jgi:Tfp pilus assembly protein PilX